MNKMLVFVGAQEKPNGISSYVYNIGTQLVILNKKVVVFQFGSCNKEYEYNKMKIIQHKAPKTSMLAIPFIFFSSLPYIIKNKKKIELVNYQSTFLAFIPCWVCRLCGIKVCFTQHSFGEDNFKHGKLVRFLISTISKISVFLCVKNFITISKSKAEEFKKKNARNCYIVPCGVNEPIELPDDDILDKFGIKKNRYFLNICRIDPIKNLDILIRAFMKLKEKDFKLVIGGDYHNSYGDELIKLSEHDNRVIFVGSVSGIRKETLLKNCYCNCLVSSSEGMPISLMEGMAYSKTCVVSDIPAIREIVNEEQGFWSKVKDIDGLSHQMKYAIEHPNDVVNKGQSLYNNVMSNYTWRSIAHTYLEMCAKI